MRRVAASQRYELILQWLWSANGYAVIHTEKQSQYRLSTTAIVRTTSAIVANAVFFFGMADSLANEASLVNHIPCPIYQTASQYGGAGAFRPLKESRCGAIRPGF